MESYTTLLKGGKHGAVIEAGHADKSELIKSNDGKTWTPERAPWSPRGAATACLFKDKVILTGGKYGGPGINGQTEFVYSNDVWQLEKK